MARRRVTFDATQEGAAEAAVRELLGLPTPARTPDGRYAAQALPFKCLKLAIGWSG